MGEEINRRIYQSAREEVAELGRIYVRPIRVGPPAGKKQK